MSLGYNYKNKPVLFIYKCLLVPVLSGGLGLVPASPGLNSGLVITFCTQGLEIANGALDTEDTTNEEQTE
jgi:hypothetical protein